MATKKRAAWRASNGSKNRSSGTKKRSSASRKKGGKGMLGGVRRPIYREAVGVILLVAGLFLTAAFFTGRGAFLGEAGLAGATRLVGLAGFALPPLAALAGLLVLLRRFPWQRALGVALILLAVATSLAAFLPPQSRFDATVYTGAGGVLGSGLYAAIHAAGGAIGAALVLVALYAIGLSFLTSITLGVAARTAGEGARSLYHLLSFKARMLRENRDENRRERDSHDADRETKRDEPPWEPASEKASGSLRTRRVDTRRTGGHGGRRSRWCCRSGENPWASKRLGNLSYPGSTRRLRSLS
jgi:hypothetical protein